MKQYMVFGSPIEHSLSPFIHQEFAKQAGVQINFSKTAVEAADFSAALRLFSEKGGVGASVTTPCKQAAFRAASRLSTTAMASASVNCLVLLPEGEWLGDNTDGIGCLRYLTACHALQPQQTRVLLLGTGAAARAIATTLLAANIKKLSVCGRSEERNLAFQQSLPAVKGSGCHVIADHEEQFDWIINATSAALQEQQLLLPQPILGKAHHVLDLNYGIRSQQLKEKVVASSKAHFVDGVGMLVYQAAEAFKQWLHFEVNPLPVLEKIQQFPP